MNGKKPLYTRTPDGSLTLKGCMDITGYLMEEAEFEGSDDYETWRKLHNSYKLDNDIGVKHVWVTNCLIEKAIEADPTWAAAHVPWEDRRALNDEG